VDLDLLAVVGLGVVVTFCIVECDGVFTSRLDLAQSEKAVCSIVSTWLLVLGAAQPPARSIRSSPALLVRILGVHRIGGAPSAPVLWTCNVDDEVRVGKRTSGAEESTPIGATARSKQFCANGATAFVVGAANVVAVGALDKRTS